MTKRELESRINIALKELENACEEAKKVAIKYGDGVENMFFEVGFLGSRIKCALYALKK